MVRSTFLVSFYVSLAPWLPVVLSLSHCLTLCFEHLYDEWILLLSITGDARYLACVSSLPYCPLPREETNHQFIQLFLLNSDVDLQFFPTQDSTWSPSTPMAIAILNICLTCSSACTRIFRSTLFTTTKTENCWIVIKSGLNKKHSIFT